MRGTHCWKCNSAVLNAMLSVLNERIFDNDGSTVKIPLQMAVGASNELPEDREELGALWDRFSLRYIVGRIRDKRNFEAMLTGAGLPSSTTTIAPEELAQAQAEASAVALNGTVAQLISLRDEMERLQVDVSERKWMQVLSLVRAHAWLEGRQKASDDDLAILTAALWDDPSQIVPVRQVIMALANPYDQQAGELLDQAVEIHANAMAAEDDKAAQIGTEANAKLKRLGKRLQALIVEAESKGRSDGRIRKAAEKVDVLNREVIKKCLGIDF